MREVESKGSAASTSKKKKTTIFERLSV